MAQWMNLQRTKKFVTPTRLYITSEKSGGMHLAELGLMAGRQAGNPVDKIWARLEILKACCRLKYSIFYFVQPMQDTALFQQLQCISNTFFRQTLLQACFIEHEMSGSPMISYRSLLFVATQ